MTDLEKVIKGLECCNDTNIASLNCEECPYRETDTCSAIARLHVDALILLREREPVKPIVGEYGARLCGKCGEEVGAISDGYSFRRNYCPECGRKVKWDAAD